MLNKIIRYFLENKIVTFLIIILFVGWGLVTAPFGWNTGILPSDPVAVDAIPDIGENQQIVFTQWMGRSPQDIEDQITYPLTTSLLGIPGVKSIRSSSIFGFSSIYIIFNEDIDFYWSRSRILEKLNSLPAGLIPDDVKPSLGPDATALGQVYWYTLEGRDKDGNPTGGWDLHEIRTVQDFYVKYGLNAVDGVSEVASIGGYVQEYQIDVNPDALKVYDIPLHKVMMAVKNSNKDVGAKTIEINQAEYLVRGLGYIKSIEDLEKAVVAVHDNVPIRIKDIAVVSLGPATRRGLLDKEGAEVVGGVVVARYGSNPLQVINSVKEKMKEIAPGLPKKTLANGVESQLTIVPFYDRTQLIYETLGTLENALSLELLITILVVIVMVLNLRASILISSLLPIAVLMVFIAMRYFGVDANIVALSGIAIAIGTMVDLGIILSENVIKHIDEASPGQKLIDTIYKASAEVSSAIATAVATTIVSFIPVFTMEAAEGKLFRPLAFTKTFALIASLIVALIILPALAHWIFGLNIKSRRSKWLWNFILITGGIIILLFGYSWAGWTLLAFGVFGVLKEIYGNNVEINGLSAHQHSKSSNHRTIKSSALQIIKSSTLIITVVSVTWLLAKYWIPLGAGKSLSLNFIFVAIAVSVVLSLFYVLERYYVKILNWCLVNKGKFLLIPAFLILWGAVIWLGFSNIFGFVAKGFDKVNVNIHTTSVWSGLIHAFPGIGKEFMPSLDEGSYLLMPTSMPHSGIEQNKRVLQQLDMMVANIPEVELVVGKMGRVESALDPAPISMYENIINYKSEYMVNKKGRRLKFKVSQKGHFILKGVNVDGNKVEIDGNKVDGNKVEIDGNKLEINGNKVEIGGNRGEINGNKVEIDGNKVDGNKVEIDGNKVEIDGNRGEINGNKVEVESNVWFNSGKYLFVDEKEDAYEKNIQNELFQIVSNGFKLYLIEDKNGNYFRNWRPHIQSPDDIWNEIVKVANIPGVTSAPKLQPIETRLVMLQTGMRAPMGIKVFGPDLKTIETFGMRLEGILKEVPSVKSETVFADRIVGKPYLHLNINRDAIARYGLSIDDVQQTIETAIGGMKITSTVEGRERFPVRVRYPRELRDDPEQLKKVFIPTPVGVQVPLNELVDLEYLRGPQMIKSENTFLVGYVLLDKKEGYAEVDVVEEAQSFIQNKIDDGELVVPSGVSYKFSGSYENQVRAEKRLAVIVPLVFIIIFLILYFQFKSVTTSLMIFTGIAMAFSGAFLMLWFYGQDWFADFSIFGTNMRDLFQMHPINLSVAVWVGFIALFGIATDDGVLMGTYLDQSFEKHRTTTIPEIRNAVVKAGQRRIKPAIMTSATTIIALMPVLTSTGRGADIMIPMAIPAFGGMIIASITYFIVPVLYCLREERRLKNGNRI